MFFSPTRPTPERARLREAETEAITLGSAPPRRRDSQFRMPAGCSSLFFLLKRKFTKSLACSIIDTAHIRSLRLVAKLAQVAYTFRKCIRCKPISPYKPCKLQSGSPDQHPRGGRESGRGICKNVITQFKGGRLIVKLTNFSYPFDVDPMIQIRVYMVCT